jgi:hypothetical protein
LLFKAILAQSQLAAKKFFNPLRPRLRSVFFTINLHSISRTTWTDEERKPPYRLQNCSTMCRLSKRIVGSFEWQPHPVKSVNPSLSGNRTSKSQCMWHTGVSAQDLGGGGTVGSGWAGILKAPDKPKNSNKCSEVDPKVRTDLMAV